MIDTFGASVRQLREAIDTAMAGEALNIPTAATQVRWLLESGRWN
jgi:hypothetical protein